MTAFKAFATVVLFGLLVDAGTTSSCGLFHEHDETSLLQTQRTIMLGKAKVWRNSGRKNSVTTLAKLSMRKRRLATHEAALLQLAMRAPGHGSAPTTTPHNRDTSTPAAAVTSTATPAAGGQTTSPANIIAEEWYAEGLLNPTSTIAAAPTVGPGPTSTTTSTTNVVIGADIEAAKAVVEQTAAMAKAFNAERSAFARFGIWKAAVGLANATDAAREAEQDFIDKTSNAVKKGASAMKTTLQNVKAGQPLLPPAQMPAGVPMMSPVPQMMAPLPGVAPPPGGQVAQLPPPGVAPALGAAAGAIVAPGVTGFAPPPPFVAPQPVAPPPPQPIAPPR